MKDRALERQTDVELLFDFIRVADSMSRHLDKALAPLGITGRQYQILHALKARGAASQADLVTATGVDRSTISDVVRRLSDRKLVSRDRNDEDARSYSVSMTLMGRKALDQAEKKAVLISYDLRGLIASTPLDELNDAIYRAVLRPDSDSATT